MQSACQFRLVCAAHKQRPTASDFNQKRHVRIKVDSRRLKAELERPLCLAEREFSSRKFLLLRQMSAMWVATAASIDWFGCRLWVGSRPIDVLRMP